MNKTELQLRINAEMEKENFQKVIDIWEKFGNKDLNFSDENDKNICDALSTSYIRMSLYREALKYLDARITSMKSSSGKEDRVENDYSNWDWYYSMKASILFEEKEYLLQYKFTLEYKKYGGHNDLYIPVLKLIEDQYYFKYFKPILYKLSYFLSIATPLMIGLNIFFKWTTSIYFYSLIGLEILILVLYLYFEYILQNIVTQLFRLFVKLIIN